MSRIFFLLREKEKREKFAMTPPQDDAGYIDTHCTRRPSRNSVDGGLNSLYRTRGRVEFEKSGPAFSEYLRLLMPRRESNDGVIGYFLALQMAEGQRKSSTGDAAA